VYREFLFVCCFARNLLLLMAPCCSLSSIRLKAFQTKPIPLVRDYCKYPLYFRSTRDRGMKALCYSVPRSCIILFPTNVLSCSPRCSLPAKTVSPRRRETRGGSSRQPPSGSRSRTGPAAPLVRSPSSKNIKINFEGNATCRLCGK
jgi:hypothetical protein